MSNTFSDYYKHNWRNPWRKNNFFRSELFVYTWNVNMKFILSTKINKKYDWYCTKTILYVLHQYKNVTKYFNLPHSRFFLSVFRKVYYESELLLFQAGIFFRSRVERKICAKKNSDILLRFSKNSRTWARFVLPALSRWQNRKKTWIIMLEIAFSEYTIRLNNSRISSKQIEFEIQ